ncbi:MAG: sensor domain-containing diguanylate cyclase [Chromatiaceae bacterium]|nr:sensor domain-containing diguanylate cyclase [Gammaproteobacteria bacterium]MCP5305335.1 sensor domain-containing diguanylate cyclase [Chromatiaceae bacterium]MCP5315294.1 sensor domain-containing diguanylate cyclase [Chromatiaceae bacterium]
MKRQPPADCDYDVQQENCMLRGLLQTLGRDAAHNQQVMARFQERELALLTAGNLTRLLERLTEGMRQSFRLDSVKLVLLDPFLVLRDLLSGDAACDHRLLRDIELCTDVRATLARFDDLHAPWLGAWLEQRDKPLFGRRLGGSVALLPLRQADGLAGFLCLGSRDPQRFQPGQATDFLGHLACVAAVCLENAVNRERLRLAGLTDSLTGLYNRRHLQHRLEQEVTRAQRYGQTLSCLFVDADHFKQINDRHGHAVGDQVLTALAQRLRARLRTSDLPTRYGGEEFAVLLPQTDAPNALRLAWEICRGIGSEPVALDNGDSLTVTVSIGVAELATQDRRPAAAAGEALLGAADLAVYEAKQAGRNQVQCAPRAA